MAKKKISDDAEKGLKLLEATKEMYDRTIADAKRRGDKTVVRQIENAKSDIDKKIELVMVGEKDEVEIDTAEGHKLKIERKPIKEFSDDGLNMLEDLFNEQKKQAEEAMGVRSDDDNDGDDRFIESDNIYDRIARQKQTEEAETREKKRKEKEKKAALKQLEKQPKKIEDEEIDARFGESGAQYDVITLPSNGECYSNKIGKIPVAYLTAYDENIIMSPNLYRDGLVIDYLLKNKIVSKDVNIDELVSGDVDAIVLFLRATSYGTEFPLTVTDPETGENFDITYDLSKLKIKEFKLKGDENGHFEYTLPLTKHVVKFKYLTRKEENNLRLLLRLENLGAVVSDLRDASDTIVSVLANDKVLTETEKKEFGRFAEKLNDWAERTEDKYEDKIVKTITNRMEMQIVEVDGNDDRDFIKRFVYNMPAMDALKLRKYIIENEPGVNFEVEVERPESLGGGSISTFLPWGDNVFFNIA